MRLKGARCLLTGASGGIGGEVARRLADRGARLALVGRRADALAGICREVVARGGEALPVVADLAGEEGRQAVVAQTRDRFGGIDLLINAAGVLDFTTFERQEPAAIERIFQTNLMAPVLLTHTVLPLLTAQGSGRIVNVGSTFGSIAFGCFAAYSASKFGLRGFSEALRRELDGSGVGVTYVAPRATRTAINTSVVMRMGEATGMNMDEPGAVAEAIVRAIEADADERYFGWPESLFVRINALLPRLVDGALRKQTAIMRRFATGEEG